MIGAARRAAFDALLAHAVGGADLPSALAAARRLLQDSRDHTLATELVGGTVRMQRALDYQLGLRANRELATLDPEVRLILRLSAFQLVYLDRVPDRAVVHDGVELARRAGKSSASGFVNAVLRRLARDADRLEWPEGMTAAALGTRHSHPDWMVERWLARYGEERTVRWLEFDNRPPRLCLAANRSLVTREALQARLLEEGVRTEPTTRAPDGLIVLDGPALSSPAFRDGWFIVQEEASQLIAGFVPVPATGRVLDLCAAPGGKTVALASRSGAAARLVACDVRPRRVRLLRTTLTRARLSHVPVVQIPAAGALPFRDRAFESVLVDAPCSGLGTLRRDPDIRWTRRPEDLPRFASAQLALLVEAGRLVADGGHLVYATCSSEPDENEAVVSAFLERDPAFALRQQHWTRPPDDGLEAFHASVMTRKL